MRTVGIVGSGNMGSHHASRWQVLPVALAGFYDADPARAVALAAKYGVVFYPFFLDGVVLDDSLMQAYGIHPNGKGVAKIVASIMPKVDELLARVKPRD